MSELAVSTPNVPASAGPLSDEAICRAFNEVRTKLLSTLFLMLGNHDDAQDAAQDAFLKCWRSRDSVQDVRDARAWIFRIGLNAAKDMQRNAWRRRSRPIEQGIQEAAPELAPPELAEKRETLERLRLALMELRPDEKAVFLLRQNADLTYEEIAAMRRSPVGTIKTQMRAALQKLKKVLKEP